MIAASHPAGCFVSAKFDPSPLILPEALQTAGAAQTAYWSQAAWHSPATMSVHSGNPRIDSLLAQADRPTVFEVVDPVVPISFL